MAAYVAKALRAVSFPTSASNNFVFAVSIAATSAFEVQDLIGTLLLVGTHTEHRLALVSIEPCLASAQPLQELLLGLHGLWLRNREPLTK